MDWYGLVLGILVIVVIGAGFAYAAWTVGVRFLLRRLASLVFVLLAITFITFILGYFAPGDAILYQLGNHYRAAQRICRETVHVLWTQPAVVPAVR
jgi:energy-coupling factor transporter transmembrane protein EcfT